MVSQIKFTTMSETLSKITLLPEIFAERQYLLDNIDNVVEVFHEHNMKWGKASGLIKSNDEPKKASLSKDEQKAKSMAKIIHTMPVNQQTKNGLYDAFGLVMNLNVKKHAVQPQQHQRHPRVPMGLFITFSKVIPRRWSYGEVKPGEKLFYYAGSAESRAYKNTITKAHVDGNYFWGHYGKVTFLDKADIKSFIIRILESDKKTEIKKVYNVLEKIVKGKA